MADHGGERVQFLSDEQMVFGDSLQATIDWCMTEAIETNTAEAWEAAHQQLRGISRLVEVMRDPIAGRFAWTILRLQSAIGRCLDMAKYPSERERWASLSGRTEATDGR